MKRLYAVSLVVFVAGVVAIGCKGGESTAGSSATASTVPYSEVQAVLTEKCAGCHGENNPKDGISLVSYEAVMKGGREGAVVVAGDPASSMLVKTMRGNGAKKMPPSGPPVDEEQIKKIESWISAGAKS